MIAAAGGSPQKVCEECQVYSWLDNGARIFVVSGSRVGRDPVQVEVIHLPTGKRSIIATSTHGVFRPLISPGGGWLSYEEGGQTIVAPLHLDVPVAADERRIIVDGKQMVGRSVGWSPDGRLLYALLETDGFRCLYTIPIDPATGRAAGAPMDVHHFHDAHLRWGSTGYGNAVVDGLFYSNHAEHSGNIWMTTLQESAR